MSAERRIVEESKDGTRTFIPEHLIEKVVKLRARDRVARAGIAAAVAIGGVLAAERVVSRNSQVAGSEGDRARIEQLENDLAELREEAHVNMVGDCVNENILRGAMGIPGATLEECREEREEWKGKMK